jgi:hypothetical protein
MSSGFDDENKEILGMFEWHDILGFSWNFDGIEVNACVPFIVALRGVFF